MVYLFWDADRDFSLVIFQIPEPVCEPRLLVGSAVLRQLFKALLLFSSLCLMERH